MSYHKENTPILEPYDHHDGSGSKTNLFFILLNESLKM